MNFESVMCSTPKVPLSDIFRKPLFSSSPLNSQLRKRQPREGWGQALRLHEITTEL